MNPPERDTRRGPSLPAAGALLLAAIAPLLGACGPEVTCSTEVTDGSGRFRAVASGRKPRPDVQKAAERAACGKLCAARGNSADDACVSRCAVDVVAGKVGARTSCEGGEGP